MRRAALAIAVVALAGCQSTQERSAALAAKAQGALHERRQAVGATNTGAVVTRTSLLRDGTSVAAIVEVRNRGAAQGDVPVALSVRTPDGRVAFRNDSPGLDPSLASIASLAPGAVVAWVNDQVPVARAATKAAARLGAARGKAPRALPALAVTGVKVAGDSSGVSIGGTIENRSRVPQKRLVVFGVARKGQEIVAAGRAIVETLPAGRSAGFTMYPIGDPRGAELTMWAPPTDLGGAS